MLDKITSVYFFEKKNIYNLSLEMASPGNRHCASCIGTLSIPTEVWRAFRQQFKAPTVGVQDCK